MRKPLRLSARASADVERSRTYRQYDQGSRGNAELQWLRPLIGPQSEQATENPGKKQQRAKKGDQDGLIKEHVSQVRGNGRPGVRAQESLPRGQEVAVVTQKIYLRSFLGYSRKFPLNFGYALLLNPAHQPASDIAAPRNRGEIVELFQQTVFGQSFEHAKMKRGAANAAAREGQASGLAAQPRFAHRPIPNVPELFLFRVANVLKAGHQLPPFGIDTAYYR